MAEAQVFCSQCGAPNSGAGAFCQKCGARIAPDQLAVSATSLQPGMVAAVPQAPVVNYVPAMSTPNPYGGFWIRLLADLIDRCLIGIVAVPMFIILIMPSVIRVIHVAKENGQPTPELVSALVSTVFGFAMLLLVGQWLYEALLTSSSWQGTIGKKVLNLKVTDEAGNKISFARATGRFFAKILSRLMMHIGFIMIAFTERKQGLHDMIAGTLVKRY